MKNGKLNIYPNLTRGTLNIDYYLPENDAIKLSLLDVYGKELLIRESTDAKGKNTIILDLSELPPGLYICDFRSGSMNKTEKVHKY